MASRLTAQDIERGRRLTGIRETLDLTQYQMADRLNDAAEAMGLPARYRYYTVSRMESGSITFEDAAIWLSLDPVRGHGWEWFVFGTPTISPKRQHPPTPIEANERETVNPHSAAPRRVVGRRPRDR